jgi:pimeloyl-ACP methyl ester carboxylesterase
VRGEDLALERELVSMMSDVASRTGHALRSRAFVVGFSRGAQLADRFALFNPGRVAAVASLSAGTYTLPQPAADLDGDGEAEMELPLPYGTADMNEWVGHSLDSEALRQVNFLVCVGGDDTNPNDLPRQWDIFMGRTRVTRAFVFERALEDLHVPARLTIFPGARHQLTSAMTASVDAFLSGL